MAQTPQTTPDPSPTGTTPGAAPGAAPGAQPSLADRLRDVVVEVRGELDISRHVFRDGPAYILRDPITFATHRFDPTDYIILSSIQRDMTLGESFSALVQRGELEPDEEESFYAFVLDLHQRSLLTLPINNADALFQRFERRRRAERMSKLMGVFFLRVPLINPDAFLSRTVPLFRWMFTTPALVAWLLLCAAALAVVVARFDELTATTANLLSADTALLMLGALIGLKVIHEFGHAYACKSFGGHVPEMGAFFVLFTPLAYVDATDSWTFTKVRQRAIVTLGGVYFESIIGAIAVFVWAATSASTLNTLAYQVIILATVTTAAFNLNPLLRYDAYYLLSDLLAIPNLKARCQEAVAASCKRVLFGLRKDTNGEPISPSPGLTAFGLAQIAYRVVMMVTIATVLTLKFGTLGVGLAAVMIFMTLSKAITSLVRYVFFSEETAPVRFRAIVSTFGVAAAMIAAVLSVPVPWPIDANGVVSFEQVRVIRAPHTGRLDAITVKPGQTCTEGETLATLTDEPASDAHDTILAEYILASSRTTFASLESPAAAIEARSETTRFARRIHRSEAQLEDQQIRAPRDGRVLHVDTPQAGVTVAAGEPMLLFASGEPEAVFHIRATEFETLRLAVGDDLRCRARAHPDREILGTVTHIDALGSREIAHRIKQAVPEGLVPISAADGRTTEPYFEIRVRLRPIDATLAGARLVAKMPTAPRTSAQVLHRRVARFFNKIKENAGH